MTLAFDFRNETFVNYGSRKLRAICEAVGFEPTRRDETIQLFSELLAPWGEQQIGESMPWRSDIGEEGTPFEFSLALSDGVPEVRIMVEAQGMAGTLASNRDAARATIGRLADKFGLSLERFLAIEDLFLPAEPEGRYSLWHAAVVRPDRPLFMKVYLNPKVSGEARAPAVVEEALKRLGLASAWRSVAAGCKRGSPLDVLKYFSIDLTSKERGRIKIYVYHQHADAAVLEAAAALGRTYVPGAVTAFCRAMTGTTGPFPGAPIATCLTFTSDDDRPEVTSTYVPFLGHVATDREASDRIRRFLADNGGDVRNFDAVLGVFPSRPLDQGAGMLSYASLRNGPGAPRVTAYLNPELYAGAAAHSLRPTGAPPKFSEIRQLKPLVGDLTQPVTFGDLAHLIRAHQAELASHPFLTRLERRGTFAEIRSIAPRVAFFVMCFQDVIRLVHRLTSDPALRALAAAHEIEDKGHDLWFLHDLERFGVSCNVRMLFSPEHETIRDVVYEQLSDVLRSADDRARLAVVLALEAAGREFFGRIIDVLEREGQSNELKYFARSHERVEQSHGIFQDTVKAEFDATVVPAEALPEVFAVIERTFATMARLADDLEAHLEQSGAQRAAIGA